MSFTQQCVHRNDEDRNQLVLVGVGLAALRTAEASGPSLVACAPCHLRLPGTDFPCQPAQARAGGLHAVALGFPEGTPILGLGPDLTWGCVLFAPPYL